MVEKLLDTTLQKPPTTAEPRQPDPLLLPPPIKVFKPDAVLHIPPEMVEPLPLTTLDSPPPIKPVTPLMELEIPPEILLLPFIIESTVNVTVPAVTPPEGISLKLTVIVSLTL